MKTTQEKLEKCLLILAKAIEDGRIDGISQEIASILYGN